MVWARIWMTGKTESVILTRDELAKKKGFSAASYILALEEGLVPVYDSMRHFQHDNAPIHRAIAVTN